jgi:glycosyltransferase involved in cell wall biosynthesis
MSDVLRRAACTIIAKNYLAYARVLSRSFQLHNPGAPVFVLVVDDTDSYIDAANEPFTIIQLKDLALDDVDGLCFKYSILELCTAVKPFFLEHLFDRFGIGSVVYLDPDILVLDSLTPLYEAAERQSIALTPHITNPINDGALPSETTFLQSGIYNLGFIGISDTPTTRRMLRWWGERCAERCIVRLEDGLFVDQKWIDLVPALFPEVSVMTAPGYNVAYWNLHGRVVSPVGSAWTVNGESLRFFHFSGYDPLLPDTVSKHQTRFKMSDLGSLEQLFAEYRARLLLEGYRDTIQWPYSYARFDDGTRISPIVRDLYYRLGPQRREFGNAFAAGRTNGFFAWLNAPAADESPTPPYISNLFAHVLSYRKDVKESFPEYRRRQRRDFLEWMRSVGHWQLELDASLLAPLTDPRHRSAEADEPGIRQVVHAFSGVCCRVCPLVVLVDRHDYGGKVRALAQRFFAGRQITPSSAGPAEAPAGPPATPKTRPARRTRSRLSAIAARIIKRTLHPCERHRLLHNLLDQDGDGLPGLSEIPKGARERPLFGVNVAGYFSTESGVGEAARLMAAAVAAADLPHLLMNFEQSYGLRRSDQTFTAFSATNLYGINLIHVNADQVPVFAQHHGRAFFGDRYNIGFWMWELEVLPAHWQDRFGWFDEIWAPSEFTARAIALRSPVPVSTMPLPVHSDRAGGLGRTHFGLPTDPFIFLFVFDFASVFERKNPLAVIDAFGQAFRPGDGALLVIKCSNADLDPENATRLREAARRHRVVLLEGYLSRAEVTSLIGCCDAYVSLHRAEGYGLTMAEAMGAGRPVIATGYSGNMEFMSPENSFLVPYRHVETGAGFGPYPTGARWAEPDVDHAADVMRRVWSDREAAAVIARVGRERIRTALAPATVGRRISAHLREAWARRRERYGP